MKPPPRSSFLHTLSALLLTALPCFAGTVTLTGGGTARAPTGTPDFFSEQAWVQAGTFTGLADTDIVELAQSPEILMEHWVPFGAGVELGCEICLQVFPPPVWESFNLDANVDIGSSSPLHGRPVYVCVLYYSGSTFRTSLVVHKTTQSFPSGDANAAIHVAVNASAPRLLAGSVIDAAGYPAATLQDGARLFSNWAFAWFDGTSLSAGADDDPDGDGRTNSDEWREGTDPRDAASRLELNWVSVSETAVILTWPTRPGARYALIQSNTPDIARPASVPPDAVFADGTQITRVIPTPPGVHRRFFAVFCW